MNSYNLDQFEIDKKKLTRMQISVISEEKHNFKTKNKTKSDMVDLLMNIIVEETKKKY